MREDEVEQPAPGEMATAAYYRVKADLCRKMAAASNDPEMREQWLQLANQWTYLVLHASQKTAGGDRRRDRASGGSG
jgi:hypothetical protein